MSHTLLRNRTIAVLIAAACAGSIHAKLPPPTPEEQAKLEAAKQKAAADAEVEKALLAKAQDRVAERYKEESGKRGGNPAAVTQEVPSAALNSRTPEKAGAYNEGVTPQTAGSALATGSRPESQPAPQNQQIPQEPKSK